MDQYRLHNGERTNFIFVHKLTSEDLESEGMDNQYYDYFISILLALYFHVIRTIWCEDFYEGGDFVHWNWIYYYIDMDSLLVYHIDIDNVWVYFISCALLYNFYSFNHLFYYVIGHPSNQLSAKKGTLLQSGDLSLKYPTTLHSWIISKLLLE